MDKKFVRVMAILFTVWMLTLTACGGNSRGAANPSATSKTREAANPSETSEEIHGAIIIGSHDNAPKVNLGLIEGPIYDICLSCGSVTLICDDGAPYSYVIDIPKQTKGLSKSKYMSIANEQTREILEIASQMIAKTEQVNTLKAVQLGARSLNSAEAEEENTKVVRKMVILDSCLSTTGALDFTKSRLNGISAENIVDQLRDLGELPDLSMIDELTVFSCGDTAGKQTTLTQANQETLKNVWNTIFEASGISASMKDNLPLDAVYDTDTLPAVTTVAVEQNSVDITSAEDAGDQLRKGVVISFDETSIAFKPGTAELADPAAAQRSLEYVVGFLNSYPDYELLVCGTTACWGGEPYCLELSEKRADAICSLLVGSGISENRLRATGVGYSFSDFYTYDQTPSGELDETIAPINRTVKIMDLHSDTADRVLAVR